MIRTLGDADLEEVRAFLDRSPFENAMLSWMLDEPWLADSVAERCFVAEVRGGNVGGVAYIGANAVIAGPASDAIGELAVRARSLPRARAICGPRASVERYWASIAAEYPPPAIARESQPLYVVDARTLMAGAPDAAVVDRATRAEIGEIADHAARMVSQEMDYAVPLRGIDLVRRVESEIDRGWWWRARGASGELLFQCHLGAITSRTAQIQGVWSPPEARRAGHATRALAAICAHLLREHPTLSLYVNDFNVPAIRLYERVGFVRAGELQTLMFR